jgi:hypothetical protein
VTLGKTVFACGGSKSVSCCFFLGVDCVPRRAAGLMFCVQAMVFD